MPALNHYQLALQVQRVYDGTIPTVNVAGIDYAIVDNEDGDIIDIITEGTHDLDDAERDLDAFLYYADWGAVHQGAYLGVEEAAQAVKARLDGGKRARCSGHSLGAMRAYFMAQALHSAGYEIAEIVTFGCPLFGDSRAVDYFDDHDIPNTTYRNYSGLLTHDIFTSIPVPLLGVPYDIPRNRNKGWSAPTQKNEFRGKGVMIEAHSMIDCYIPLVKAICNG